MYDRGSGQGLRRPLLHGPPLGLIYHGLARGEQWLSRRLIHAIISWLKARTLR
jgi:hypothetical protein